MRIEPTLISAKDLRSLCFDGDGFVDWVGGARVVSERGEVSRPAVLYGYRFDSAVQSPCGRFAAIYGRLGTKGLLLDAKTAGVIREIDRSYYMAEAYLFPIAFMIAPSGHTLLVTCSEYNQLEFEDLDTKTRLSCETERECSDFFHSRLQQSPGGTRFLSAGWVWHPVDGVGCYSLAAVLADLKAADTMEAGAAFVLSATFQDEHTLIVSTQERFDEDGGMPKEERAPHIGRVDLRTDECRDLFSLEHDAGELMVVGEHLVTFFEYPRLYRLADGVLEHEWPELDFGKNSGSIVLGQDPPKITAIDRRGARFAAYDGEVIRSVDLSSLRNS